MKLAHVRPRDAPAGAPWRLAAAVGDRWLNLELARRDAIAKDPQRRDAVLLREPVTTLDDHLARGLRVETFRELVEAVPGPMDEDRRLLRAPDLEFGPPVLRPPSMRDFYAFEQHVGSVWGRHGRPVPDAWYRMPIFYFSNVSEIRGPGDAVWAPDGCVELDFELEVCAVVDTPAVNLPADRAEATIGGYTILNDWSARDLQREESAVRLGPAKGKDFATSIGPWLVTPDELADAQRAKGYDLTMTAQVGDVEVSRGRWSDVHYSFGEMLARASADAQLRPGDLIGSGTVGTGCLYEVREATLGRWLRPGDVVTLAIERLGELQAPVVARP